MTDQERAEYGIKTLRQLAEELQRLGQFEKYPSDIGALSWIKRELKKYSLDCNVLVS